MGRGLPRWSLKPNISSVARLLAYVTGLVNQELLLNGFASRQASIDSQSSAIRACYHSRKPFHPFGRTRFTVSRDCPVPASFVRGQMVSVQSGFLGGFHSAKFLRSGEFWVMDQLQNLIPGRGLPVKFALDVRNMVNGVEGNAFR